MKLSKTKQIIFLLSFIFFCSFGFSYSPTTGDKQNLDYVKITIMQNLNNNQQLRDYYYQTKLLKNKYSFDARLNFMLSDINGFLWSQINKGKTFEKSISKASKQNFLNKYITGITNNSGIEENCIGWYNTMDDIAYTHNFPTSLIIGTWFRETNCGYYLPSNGDGPFQIVAMNYGTGDITEDIFVQSIIDYINFTKNKINWYNERNAKSGLNINISYTGFDLTGIVRVGALYNGLSGHSVYGDIKPLNPNYVWDNYGSGYSGSLRNGLLPQTLRALERELENKY